MSLKTIKSISPLDGRYHDKTKELSEYFSEYAYHKYRVLVEIEYLIYFSEINVFDLKNIDIEKTKQIYKNFSTKDSERIKEIEKITNHDVKAIEYFIKEKLKEAEIIFNYEFVHFGLTSQDINSVANVLRLKECIHQIIVPCCQELLELLQIMGENNINLPMLSRTHGQPASPTLLGKEILVFCERIHRQIDYKTTGLLNIEYSSKFGGAIGNNNANYFANDKINWNHSFTLFLERLNLHRHTYTTQIDHYDNLSEIFDNLNRICIILVDLCTDFWQYISNNYFIQKVVSTETGSSTMPHKVNPIDFENAEGNLLLASNMFQFLSRKLPISRLQRDLTDSTITRNIGVGLAHMLISMKSCIKGLNKLTVNKEKIIEDLDNNSVVIAEGIQTFLRYKGVPDAYEKIKDLTRNNNNRINKQDIEELLSKLDLEEEDKQKIRTLTPQTYVGKVYNPNGN